MSDQNKPQRIKKQIEFYFSDSNLYRDKFLSDRIAEDRDGFVDIGLLCTFSRLQSILAGKTKIAGAPAPRDGPPPPAPPPSDAMIAEVAAALDDSTALVLSDDKRRVRRAQTLGKSAEEILHEVDARSLYASPFPWDVTLDALTTFFEGVAKVNGIRMRRHMTSKDFRGSIFVEFATTEEAARMRGLSLVFEGAPLQLEPKVEYMKRKEEERHARFNSPYNNNNYDNHGGHQVEFNKPPVSLKRPRGDAGDSTFREGGMHHRSSGPLEGSKTFEREHERGRERELIPGCILEFYFGSDPRFKEPVTFGLVKDSFGGRDRGLQYVDYTPGDKLGYVRFGTPEAAVAAAREVDKDGTRMIGGYPATVRLLWGEEERQYLEKAQAARADAERAPRGRGGSRGRGGRGHPRGGRGPPRGRGGGGRRQHRR